MTGRSCQRALQPLLGTVLALTACGSPAIEIDVIVDQDKVVYQYRGEGCVCQPRFPQPGEGYEHQPADTSPVASCDCAETCLERFDTNADGTFTIVACGGSAHGSLPTALEATPNVELLDQDGRQFAVTVESPATSFYYSYGCPGGGERFDEFHVEGTSGTGSDVCSRTTPVLIRSHRLTDTLDTDIGTIRLWSSHSLSQ